MAKFPDLFGNDPLEGIDVLLGLIPPERVQQWDVEFVNNPSRFLQEILCQIAVMIMLEADEATKMCNDLEERVTEAMNNMGAMTMQERFMSVFMILGACSIKLETHMRQRKEKRETKENAQWN